jgi:Rrf2 family protein
MKVSAQEEYGLRCLLQLARLGAGESLTLSQIAKREGISQANAGKVLWLLSRTGLVASNRGTKGGYRLARPASDIHLSEIIKMHDEDVLSGHCKSYAGVLDACVHTGNCGIRPMIVGLQDILQQALSHVTLAQLLGNEAKVETTLHQIHAMSRHGAGGRESRASVNE